MESSVPDVGVVFKLTIEPVRGLDMVANEYLPQIWFFTGQELTKSITHRFMLMRVGYQPNLEEVLDKLDTPTTRPCRIGQAREAFRKAYPISDGKLPIGFPDPSWCFTSANFPMLGNHFGGHGGKPWTSSFYPARYWHGVEWRWLVEVKKNKF